MFIGNDSKINSFLKQYQPIKSQFWPMMMLTYNHLMPQIKDLSKELVLAAPGVFALLFAGPAFYVSELDPIVRQQHSSTKTQLKHWSKMYSLGLKTMPIPALLGTISAAIAYHKTNEKYWLYGAVALFSVIPYTFLAIMPTNKQLNAVLEQTKDKVEVQAEKVEGVVEGMKKWVKLHRVRAILALGAAGLFFVARTLSKEKIQ